MPEDARTGLRGNSGVRSIPVERMASPANDQQGEEFDMSGWGDAPTADEATPVVEAKTEPEPEELDEDYLKEYMAEVPGTMNPAKVAYPGDIRKRTEEILNRDPDVSREVDKAFDEMIAPPGPPPVPPPKGTRPLSPRRIEPIKDFQDKHYTSKTARELAEAAEEGEAVTAVHDVKELQAKLAAMKRMAPDLGFMKDRDVTDMRKFNPDGTGKFTHDEGDRGIFRRDEVLAAAEPPQTTPKQERVETFDRAEIRAAIAAQKKPDLSFLKEPKVTAVSAYTSDGRKKPQTLSEREAQEAMEDLDALRKKLSDKK